LGFYIRSYCHGEFDTPSLVHFKKTKSMHLNLLAKHHLAITFRGAHAIFKKLIIEDINNQALTIILNTDYQLTGTSQTTLEIFLISSIDG